MPTREPSDAAKFNGKIPNILSAGKVTRSTDGRHITETWDVYVAGVRVLRLIAHHDPVADIKDVRVMRPKNGTFPA